MFPRPARGSYMMAGISLFDTPATSRGRHWACSAFVKKMKTITNCQKSKSQTAFCNRHPQSPSDYTIKLKAEVIVENEEKDIENAKFSSPFSIEAMLIPDSIVDSGGDLLVLGDGSF